MLWLVFQLRCWIQARLAAGTPACGTWSWPQKSRKPPGAPEPTGAHTSCLCFNPSKQQVLLTFSRRWGGKEDAQDLGAERAGVAQTRGGASESQGHLGLLSSPPAAGHTLLGAGELCPGRLWGSPVGGRSA